LFALLLLFFLKPQPNTAFRWLHGLFLLLMVPFGFHWLPQGPVLRCETGILFGFGIVAYLWLVPGARQYGSPTSPRGRLVPRSSRRKEALTSLCRLVLRRDLSLLTSAATPIGSIEQAQGRGLAERWILSQISPGYAGGLLGVMVFVPGLALGGGRMGAVILSWLAGLGFLTLMGLVLINLACGLMAVARRWRAARAKALA